MSKRFIFTYMFCNDLEKMKKFYSSILGLQLIWDSPEDIAFKIKDHQLSIAFDKNYHPLSPDFSIQPGWAGGTEPRISWSIECDEDDFSQIVRTAIENDVPSYYERPNWKGYWSFPVLDPMNQTIEITCTKEDLAFE